MKFRKGDEITITAGKDEGKRGKIEKIFPKNNTVFLPGLNIYKKHLKKQDEKHQWGIVEFSRPVPVSSIALNCPKCGKQTRIGYKITGSEKVRICRKCGANI